MEMLNYFHLFSFLPVLAFGGVFWYERMHRHGAQKRTTYLFLSLLCLALVGVIQTGATTFAKEMPFTWPQVFVLSGILYFGALIFLEYAIHVKRIEESFLLNDYRKELMGMMPWAIGVAVVAALVVLMAPAWQWSHKDFPLSLFLNDDAKNNDVLGYTQHMRLLSILYTVILLVVAFLAARKLFNLQEGVIRKRGYPFYAQMVTTFVLLISILASPPATEATNPNTLAIAWFLILNLVYIVRLVEEFFFWSQFNLRSDRDKIEARQHTQTLLIRRVIGSSDAEDKVIVRELMESALEKAKSRMVVAEYQMTGMAVYRLSGQILKVEDVSHIIGYTTPLVDSKSIKALDKSKLNDQILRTVYDIGDLRDTMLDNLKDWGKKLIKRAMTEKQVIVTNELPEGLKGLQRLAVLVPIFDSNSFMGFLTVFKDSFDRLYPAERDVLLELAENLATVYALMAGKEIQRERNRLQGEMNTAREIQTSILPKKAQMPGYQVGTYMETATEVGGDVFDFIPTPYGTYFGIGDVAGHGLPAGMMAVISVAALHGAVDASKVLGKPLPLDQVYDTVNRVLCTINRDRIGSDKFMTQNYLLEKDGHLQYVGSHLIALVYRKATDSIEELSDMTGKAAYLGLSEFAGSAGSLGSFKMASGDVLVLYSDGVSEAMNGNGTMFGLDGLKRALVDHGDKHPQEFIEATLEDLRRHATAGDLKKHGGHFTDDISFVVVKKE